MNEYFETRLRRVETLIIDLTKMVQGNDSFFLCQVQSGRFLEARVKTGRSFQ